MSTRPLGSLRVALAQVAAGLEREENIRRALRLMRDARFERAAPGRTYDCSPVFDTDGNYLGKQRMIHILKRDEAQRGRASLLGTGYGLSAPFFFRSTWMEHPGRNEKVTTLFTPEGTSSVSGVELEKVSGSEASTQVDIHLGDITRRSQLRCDCSG
jgi:hypothetical protein